MSADEYLGIDAEVDSVIKDVLKSEWARNSDPADNMDAWSAGFQTRLLAAALKTNLMDRVRLDPALFASPSGGIPPIGQLVQILNRSYARAKTRAPIDEIERRVKETVDILGPDKDTSGVPKLLAEAIATDPPADLDAFVTEVERRFQIRRIKQAAEAAILKADQAWITTRGAPDEVQKAVDALIPVATAPPVEMALDPDTFESVRAFLTSSEPEMPDLFPGIIPLGVQALFHGEPRARKSLGGFEFALSGATGTAPFGLERFKPKTAFPVLYVMEEDPRGLTRRRIDRLVRERVGENLPDTLEVSVRKGINLDDPRWVERIVQRVEALGAKLVVFDAARRLSAKTDEGPQKVRELTAVLRSIITKTGCSIIIVHHDVKPSRDGQDNQRSRGHRASGGDWFAASECPIHFERLDANRSLVFPTEYKFSDDPVPFTFECRLEAQADGTFLVRAMTGTETTTLDAKRAGLSGKLVEWLRTNGAASRTAMKAAGFGWTSVSTIVDGLLAEGVLDSIPGRTKGSILYFVRRTDPSPRSETARNGDD